MPKIALLIQKLSVKYSRLVARDFFTPTTQKILTNYAYHMT